MSGIGASRIETARQRMAGHDITSIVPKGDLPSTSDDRRQGKILTSVLIR
jgi:hypothetical protein